MEDKLDYSSPNIDNRPPYVFFEEAFPAVVSKNLSEEDVWYIHEQTKLRWGTKRNSNPMPPVALRDENWHSDCKTEKPKIDRNIPVNFGF